MTAPARPADAVALRHDTPGSTPRVADAVEPLPVVVPEAGRFEGLLTFRGSARLEGEFKGEIVCRGCLHVGVNAQVEASIEVDELVVAGTVVGDVFARRRIQLSETARVKGLIRAPQVAIADGCIIDGRCETGEPASRG